METLASDLILESLFDGVYVVDVERRISYWNPGAERITGYPREDVVGSCCSDNILCHVNGVGRELCFDGCPLAATIADGRPREVKAYLRHRLGHRVPVLIRTSPVRDSGGKVVGAVEVFTDYSSSLQVLDEYEKLQQEAYLDRLTAVGNRRYAEMNLSTRLYDLHNNRMGFGLVFIDLDHFKAVNDRYGHPAGDDILVMAANSMAKSLRRIDVLTRWGGEEFLAILPGANDVTLDLVAERIRSLVEKSYVMVQEEKLAVTVSVGGTLARMDDDQQSLVARADELMYRSKKKGRNCVTVDKG
ncbi:diguanylate cyclase [Geomonas sp. Red276]